MPQDWWLLCSDSPALTQCLYYKEESALVKIPFNKLTLLYASMEMAIGLFPRLGLFRLLLGMIVIVRLLIIIVLHLN